MFKIKYLSGWHRLWLTVVLLCSSVQGVHAAESQAAAIPSVNINQAQAEQLAEVLRGVGDRKALAIIAYRDKNGPFESVESLAKVKGISPRLVELNRSRIRVD